MKINLRERLLNPGGTTRIWHTDFYYNAFVEQCISEAEALSITGSEPSPLQKLAIYVLLSSAYIDEKELKEISASV